MKKAGKGSLCPCISPDEFSWGSLQPSACGDFLLGSNELQVFSVLWLLANSLFQKGGREEPILGFLLEDLKRMIKLAAQKVRTWLDWGDLCQ